MPAIKILGGGKYEDAYTGKPVDQYGNKLKTTPTVTPAIVPTATAITTENDIQDAIKAMKQAQISAAVAGLAKSRDTALSNLAAEKATIQPEYYKKRNVEATASQLQAKNFAEYMAQRGGASSGVAAQAELARNVALQGNIGALNQQETADYGTNARRVADTQNAYESDVTAAKAGAEANAMQLMIAEMQRQATAQQAMEQFNKSFGLQEAGVTGKYNGQDTLAALQDAFNRSVQEAQLMGTYNGQQTLASQAQALQKAFEEAQLLGTYNGQSTLAAQQLAQQLAQQQWENAFNEKQLAAQTAYQNASLARSSSGGGSSTKSLSSAELTALQNQAQNDAYALVDYLNGQGWNEGQIRNEITRMASSGELDMVDIPKLKRYLEYDRYNFGSK